jgi:hypothetical protein
VTPDLQLRTLFLQRHLVRGLLESHGRITVTTEPSACPAPLFVLIRGTSDVAWGVRNDVAVDIADELDRLAGDEPPVRDFQAPPMHADAYLSLVGGQIVSGPAFRFPDEIPAHRYHAHRQAGPARAPLSRMDRRGDCVVFADRRGHGRRLFCQCLLLRNKEFSAGGRGGTRNGHRFSRTRICSARDGSLGLRHPCSWTNPSVQH